jgi:hypothetical protein
MQKKKPEARTERLDMRTTPTIKELAEHHAQAAGVKVTTWIEQLILGGKEMSYATKEETAAITRKATPDELWLECQLERISPNRNEMDSAGETPALTILVFELRRENQRLQGEAKVMRDLLGEAHEFLNSNQIGPPALERQIEAALWRIV